MLLFVRGLKQSVVECQENDSILNVKVKVSLLEGISVDEIRLYANGEPLDNGVAVGSLTGVELQLNVGLLGGKVHGSLARAGKVKGQTPKVDKQEKKKLKTGRAKRRFQYNRRFVNVVVGFGGRKKGPNSNNPGGI